MHRPPRFPGFISDRNELFCNTCLPIFPMEKINQQNVPDNLFHASKISVRNFYLTCYQCSRSTSLDSFVILLLKKLFKKKYIALTKTCVNKDVCICVNKLLNARVQIRD